MPKWVITKEGGAINLDRCDYIGADDLNNVIAGVHQSDDSEIVNYEGTIIVTNTQSTEEAKEFIRLLLLSPDEVVLSADIKAAVQEGDTTASSGAVELANFVVEHPEVYFGSQGINGLGSDYCFRLLSRAVLKNS